MILKKKGSHVGMILSFVLFITFVVFLYTLLNPSVGNVESKRTLLNEIGLRIIQNMSVDFSIISVSIDSSTNPSTKCVNLKEFLFASGIALIELSEEGEVSARVIIKDEENQIQNVYYDLDSNLSILVDRTTKDYRFFKIYHSPVFEPLEKASMSSCKSIDFEEGYVIGSINTGKYIFEKNLYDLIERYEINYEKLKRELKISSGNEFAFDFGLNDGTILSVMEDSPSSGNVYAEEIPVQYVDDEANILSGFINIKVW